MQAVKRKCRRCEEEKDIEDFYAKKSDCKKCYIANQKKYYEYKPNGFRALSEEDQKNLIEDLKTKKIKDILGKYNISITSLYTIRKDLIKNQLETG